MNTEEERTLFVKAQGVMNDTPGVQGVKSFGT
jgi:hypothetical protein